MAPQFTLAEVDFMQQQAAAGHKPPEVLRRMAQRRARRGLAPPDATSVRRVLKGKTHARAKTETRGRKPSLSPGVVQKMNRVRRGLVKKANNRSSRTAIASNATTTSLTTVGTLSCVSLFDIVVLFFPTRLAKDS